MKEILKIEKEKTILKFEKTDKGNYTLTTYVKSRNEPIAMSIHETYDNAKRKLAKIILNTIEKDESKKD